MKQPPAIPSSEITPKRLYLREGKRYTPAEVIQHLVGHEAGTFDAEIAISKERLRDYPHLFQDDLPALQKAEAHERRATPAKPPKKATRPAKRSAVA